MSTSLYGIEPGLLAIAHRGGAALAPENTLAAFRRAHALGFRYLETDVRVTADGVCLAFHDAKLNRVTTGRGLVARHTWEQVSRLRVQGDENGMEYPQPEGEEPVARLDQVLRAFPDARFIIDVKEEAAIDPLAALLKETGADTRVCVAGAWDGWLLRLREAVGPSLSCALGWRALTSWLTCSRLRIRPPQRVATGGFVHVPARLGRVPVFIDRMVAGAHALGLRVIVWTVNEPGHIRRLISAGVDGIITDRPDVLREVMISENVWLSDRGPRLGGAPVYAERPTR